MEPSSSLLGSHSIGKRLEYGLLNMRDDHLGLLLLPPYTLSLNVWGGT